MYYVRGMYSHSMKDLDHMNAAFLAAGLCRAVYYCTCIIIKAMYLKENCGIVRLLSPHARTMFL